MKISALDWTLVVIYFILALGVGVYFAKRGGASIIEYFTSEIS